MTVDDSIKCRFANSGVTDQVGGFQNPGVCLQAFPSFLPHPLPALLLAPLFSRSLTLVPLSFLLNRTETLATQAMISAINRHFRHFCQIRHFRQYHHFPKGPFAIVFEFLFTVWRVWRLIAISAIFAKYAIFAKIATFQRAPLPSHLNFCLQFGNFGD